MISYSDSQMSEAVSLAHEHGSSVASLRTGIPPRTIRKWKAGTRTFRSLSTPAASPSPSAPTDAQESVEHEYAGANHWTINLKSEKVSTYEELVAHCKVDLTTWEPDRFKSKSYQMTYVPRSTRATEYDKWVRPTTEAQTVQMFAVTASFKRKIAVIDARTEIASLVAEAKTIIYRAPLPVYTVAPGAGHMLELGLPDAHFGKYVWGRETGGANYDLDIAVETYRQAVETLLERSAHIAFERVLLVVGNDLLNSDNNEGTTTKGTRQDNDGRHFKVFQTARRATVEVAERLARDVAPVQIVVLPGNHDALSTLLLGDSLDCWFHGSKHISVDAEPTARKYVEFGRTMLGFAHGDRGKAQLWSRLMPVERPEMWARTTFREMHTAHLHKESAQIDEVSGVKVRVLPSLSPPDAWHAGEGYVGNQQCAEAFWWSAKEGLVGTALYTHRGLVAEER